MRFWRNVRRSLLFWWQRRTRGWDDSDTWNLDSTIAEFVLPRLRRFRELNNGIWANPDTAESDEPYTENAINDIEWLLNVHASEEGTWQLTTPELQERYNKASKLFAENFGNLWW